MPELLEQPATKRSPLLPDGPRPFVGGRMGLEEVPRERSERRHPSLVLGVPPRRGQGGPGPHRAAALRRPPSVDARPSHTHAPGGKNRAIG